MLFGGLALTTIGVVVGAWTMAHTLGPETASAGTMLLSVAPLLSGVHMLLFALMLDIQSQIRGEHSDTASGTGAHSRDTASGASDGKRVACSRGGVAVCAAALATALPHRHTRSWRSPSPA